MIRRKIASMQSSFASAWRAENSIFPIATHAREDCMDATFHPCGRKIALCVDRFPPQGRKIVTGAAATKPPQPVVFRQVVASHIYATKSPPPVIFVSVQVSHIQCDWRRLEAVSNVIVQTSCLLQISSTVFH